MKNHKEDAEFMAKYLEMLDSLFTHATEGIVVVDQKGTIFMVNPMAERMFGYEQKELLGQAIEILIPSKYKPKHVEKRDNYIHQPTSRPMGKGMDLFAAKKNGEEFPVEVSLSYFNTSEGQFVMSFIIDITERKKQEMQLKMASERLQQTSEALSRLNAELESKVADRTAELALAIKELADSKKEVVKALEKEKELNTLKSRFVTTASHEFRTPLGTILSSASLIGRYNAPEDEDKRGRHIERIRSSVNNLTEILNDFLSLDKLEEGIIRNNPVEFPLEPFIGKVTDELRAILKNGQSIAYDHEEEYTLVNLDQQLFRNVIINLVSNAIKYSPEDSPIKVQSIVEKERIIIMVSDKGIGIPIEDQPHLFTRFFRAQNATNIQGTGLGLNIVKKYIELMNGEIGFVSEISQGTTFRILLPLLKTQADQK
jgi:PAS domain S-box-containing protein